MPTPFKGEILSGRSNFREWEPKAILFLEINGYMPYIDGSKTAPDKQLYYKSTTEPYSTELAVKYVERMSDFKDNQLKALGALKSIISIENVERFKGESNKAKTLWEIIKKTFRESTFELIGRYIDKINNATYNSSKNMDEYTSIIQSSAYYLREMKQELSSAFLAWKLF